MKEQIVVFTKKEAVGVRRHEELPKRGVTKETRDLSKAINQAREFEELARRIMSRYFGVELRRRRRKGWPKEFDLVSPDYRIVGDAKYYTLVRGRHIPPAKFATIAEHVWMLENIDADIKFLVFGNDKRVPIEWLRRYGYMVRTVKFYFISNDGKVEELL